MNSPSIQQLIGNTDIYLLDQILKNRYRLQDKILDAGCGAGRNLHWFLKNGMKVYGLDKNAAVIENLKEENPSLSPDTFQVAPVERIPFGPDFFDHIISIAVLHFAESTSHFMAMMAEMVRVLKPNGSLFIRMTSDIGIETKVEHVTEGVYLIPDKTKRFLLTKPLLRLLLDQYQLSFLESLKTVNVDDMRCMSTLVLRKRNNQELSFSGF